MMNSSNRIEKLLNSIALESYHASGVAIPLDNPNYCVVVLSGALDLFFTAHEQAKFPAFGGEVSCGGVIKGISPVNDYFFVGVPIVNSFCIRVKISDLEHLCRRDLELKEFFENGVKLAETALTVENSQAGEFYLNCWQEQEQSESLRLQKHLELRERKISDAMSKIANVISISHKKVLSSNPLWGCCQALNETMGLGLKSPDINILESLLTPEEQIKTISDFNQVRYRPIELSSDWYKEEFLPFIGFTKESQHPIALLGQRDGRIKCYDSRKGGFTYLDKQSIQEISTQAWSIYEPLPDGEISKKTLLAMALKNSRKELRSILFLLLLGSLLAVTVPMINGLIFSEVIPSADRILLLQLFGISLLLAVVSSIFEYVISVLLLRVHVRGEYRLQAAVWDRVLNLPTRFFRQYSAGDLASRVLGIMQMGEVLNVATVKSIISGLFCFPSIILMFYYDTPLTVISLLIMGLILFSLILTGGKLVKHYSKILHEEGALNGELIQFFIGISKIRIAGAEDSCFGKWAERFSHKKEIYRSFAKCRSVIVVINSIAPITMTLVVLSIVTYQYFNLKSGDTPMSVADFIVFVSALSIVSSALTQQVSAILGAISILPIYQRMKPILTEKIENISNKASSNKLQGAISVNGVSFSYENVGTPTLSNLNMEIKRGEFVAIVGESGAGKSTLLRLLLGFETPSTGSICYDGQDISQINPKSLRAQIGVVLQTSRLLAGSILQNIIGSSGKLTVDDAWEAARLAGCEQDIKEMPMGMQTLLQAGSGAISGGQRQRIMIARALAKRPELLLFDEATSALDNATQAAIAGSIENLKVTRVVIAHRLSTIKNADRIYVLSYGRVCEVGNYQQLLEKSGIFAKLVTRQMLEKE